MVQNAPLEMLSSRPPGLQGPSEGDFSGSLRRDVAGGGGCHGLCIRPLGRPVISRRTVTITTTVAARVRIQPAGSLQPDGLARGRVRIPEDASPKPGSRGPEAEERREGAAGSLFLSKYPN